MNQSAAPPPGAQEFLANNPWFDKDKQLTAYANGIAEDLNRQGYYGEAYFKQLEKEVMEAFPHKFNKRPSSSPVETEGAKPATQKGKAFADLPAEAQKACKQFMRDIPGFTEKDYLEQYDWSE